MYYDSEWIAKLYTGLMKQGKKYLVEAPINDSLSAAKFEIEALPSRSLLTSLKEFRPVLLTVNKRMGRRFNAIPIPIQEWRQHVVALRRIVRYIKQVDARYLLERFQLGFHTVICSKKFSIHKDLAAEVVRLAEARFFSYQRWR